MPDVWKRLSLVAAGAAVLAAAGCRREPPQGATAGAPSAVQTASAQAIFEKTGCGACHGSMTAGGGSAPDLSHEGARRQQAWIEAQIRNPRSHVPTSMMPSYEGRLADEQIRALAAGLAQQK